MQPVIWYAVPEIITAQDQEQPTEPDSVQMICYP